MIEDPLFWKLPHALRRGLFRFVQPDAFETLSSYRDLQPEKISAQTFKPFLDSKTLFVHIPKTAGIAIGHAVYGRHTGNHTTFAEYQLAFSKSECASFFSFTFVRNPWDRLLSAYTFMKAGGRNDGDRAWSEKHLSSFLSFNEFVQKWVTHDNVHKGIHFKPQFEFITLPGSDQIRVDFVGRYEQLQEDWENLSRHLKTKGELKPINQTAGKTRDYRDMYTTETKEIVANVYAKDIALFGYTFT